MSVDPLIQQLQGKVAGEEWREVGAAGEPAFANSWVNYDGSRESAAFYKLGDRVYLKGVIKNGSAVNTTAFTLPVGYRPAKELWFAVMSNGAIGRLEVGADGAVRPATGSTAHYTLDGVSFRVGS